MVSSKPVTIVDEWRVKIDTIICHKCLESGAIGALCLGHTTLMTPSSVNRETLCAVFLTMCCVPQVLCSSRTAYAPVLTAVVSSCQFPLACPCRGVGKEGWRQVSTAEVVSDRRRRWNQPKCDAAARHSTSCRLEEIVSHAVHTLLH